MEKFGFKTKIHLACSKDNLRPQFNYVYFIDGFMYASDSYILIKQSLGLHEIINPELLDGKCVHFDLYAKMLSYPIIEAIEEGINCITTQGGKLFFKYSEIDFKVPRFQLLLDDLEEEKSQVGEIGLDSKKLKQLMSVMFLNQDRIKMTFHGESKAVKVTSIGIEEKDQVALLMSVPII